MADDAQCGMFFSQRDRIVALAKNYDYRRSIPRREFVEAGGTDLVWHRNFRICSGVPPLRRSKF